MAGDSSALRREIEGFRQATGKISERINGVGDIWKDSNYASLQKQIGELAKKSKTINEYGDRACSSIDKFFTISAEEVK